MDQSSWITYEPIFLEDEEENIKEEPPFKDDMNTHNPVLNSQHVQKFQDTETTHGLGAKGTLTLKDDGIIRIKIARV